MIAEQQAWVADERGRGGRYQPAGKTPTLPARRAGPPAGALKFKELGDGRVQLVDAKGEVAGTFANKQLAIGTRDFLTR